MVVIVVIVRMSPGADMARGNVDVTAHVPRFLRVGADRPGLDDREGRRGGGGNIDPARSNTSLDPGRQRVVKLRGPVRYAVGPRGARKRWVGIRIRGAIAEPVRHAGDEEEAIELMHVLQPVQLANDALVVVDRALRHYQLIRKPVVHDHFSAGLAEWP